MPQDVKPLIYMFSSLSSSSTGAEQKYQAKSPPKRGLFIDRVNGNGNGYLI